jgi:hypothetical protein
MASIYAQNQLVRKTLLVQAAAYRGIGRGNTPKYWTESRSNVCSGSWPRENAEIEFANGNFVSTSINTELTPGTVLVREWDRQSQRVMVMANGFAWNGQTFDSLSKVAFAITGTKWNGPRFFGLRDKEDRSTMEARP